uniref:Amidase domain-containing protein n=2 Tax=Oryza TaxID=4527 RepID=A0A0E0GXU0_ORYNI
MQRTAAAILGFSNGSLTSTALVRFYLHQITRLNPLLHAVIEVNPDALAQAARADAERATGRRCGPLHSVRVLLKDNIATRDRLNTTAGKHGAMVIENIDIAKNLTEVQNVLFSNEHIAMIAEFKLSLNAYLSDLLYSPVRSLADVIAFNKAHPVEERLKDFGQPYFIEAEKTNGVGPVEKASIQHLNKLSADGLEKLMRMHQLDAIVTPNNNGRVFFAVSGMPAITVPAGYDSQGVPFGTCFGGLKGYEPRLIEMAYAYEQATKVRMMPGFKM